MHTLKRQIYPCISQIKLLDLISISKLPFKMYGIGFLGRLSSHFIVHNGMNLPWSYKPGWKAGPSVCLLPSLPLERKKFPITKNISEQWKVLLFFYYLVQ